MAISPLTTTLDLRAGDVTGAELSLARDAAFATSVAVVASAPTAAPAAETVPPVQVLRTPGALDNVFRTLQTLPGVAATEEFGSRLAVRGGSPDQNLTVMDGVEIHDPYRLFGLTSAFNPETIQRFELATGGFSVKYGDRLSSLLVVENRDGARQEPLTGSASLSITDANVVLEGGLPRQAAGSWLVTGRRTYYDLVARARRPIRSSRRFADVQGKGVWEPAPGRTLSLFGLRSRQAAALDIRRGRCARRVPGRHRQRPGLGPLRRVARRRAASRTPSLVVFEHALDVRRRRGVREHAASDRTRRATTRSASPTSSSIARSACATLSLRQELGWARGAHVVEAGGELHRLSTALSFDDQRRSQSRRRQRLERAGRRGSARLADLVAPVDPRRRLAARRWQAGAGASLEAGVRVDRSGINRRHAAVAARRRPLWRSAPHTRLRAAVGRYTQSPGYEKLAQSDYVLDSPTPNAGGAPQRAAVAASVGLERDLAAALIAPGRGLLQALLRLLVGRLEPEAERLARVARYDFPAALAVERAGRRRSSPPCPTNDGRGRAYGFDLFVSRTTGPAAGRARAAGRATPGAGPTRDAYGRRYPVRVRPPPRVLGGGRRIAVASAGSWRRRLAWRPGFPRTPPLGVRVAGARGRRRPRRRRRRPTRCCRSATPRAAWSTRWISAASPT